MKTFTTCSNIYQYFIASSIGNMFDLSNTAQKYLMHTKTLLRNYLVQLTQSVSSAMVFR